MLKPTLTDSDSARRCDYIERGLYAKHFKRLRRYFPEEQIHALLLEDLREDPIRSLNSLLQGIADLEPVTGIDTARRHNTAALPRSESLARLQARKKSWRTARRLYGAVLPAAWRDGIRDRLQRMNERPFQPPPMDPDTRSRLGELFRPSNEELMRLTGLDTSHWT